MTLEDGMDQHGSPNPDLGEELRSLGANLKQVLQEAWESDERARLQHEIESGLKDAADALRDAATEFEQSPAGQRLKSEMKDLGDKMRTGEVQDEARSELVEVLRRLNQELQAVASRLSERRPSGDSAEKA
jgi:ElaB/YqjD/DUF883 family membrane-anchored ribosome-binding protein